VQSTVDDMRAAGKKVGMMRPISLWPFPSAHINELGDHARQFLVVELSNGQMVDDVRLALNGKRPVHLHNRMGGMVPSPEEVQERALKILEG
ncbi:MAG TPA: 3-methyl-2-oxobutanoate dehydrogenase subunit beta, partial [bacterium]|nr:3-methyl-2-oxobutanoate dehydrogenase subunit beta [bacterium]